LLQKFITIKENTQLETKEGCFFNPPARVPSLCVCVI
jgi:hypothetical protein